MNSPTEPRTRRERVEAREEAIIAAAQQVFGEHGFDGARITDIARLAEVAEGTIYLYFKNKEALLHAVVGAFYQRLTASAQEGVQGLAGTRRQLEFLARHHMISCLTEWHIIEMTVGRYRQLSEYESSGYLQFNKTYVAVFDNVLREGMNRGEIRKDIPIWNIRDLFYGSLDYSCRTYMLRGHAPDDLVEIARNVQRLMNMVWQGIARPGEEGSDHADLESITRRLEAAVARLE
jgi:TetR/AcrR family fatty acid metabolism transcriptional regulator